MMVSTLVPPHKRKTKHDSKAVEMPSSIDNSKNKKRKKSPTAKVEVAPLYKEDIGKVGVKEAKPAKSSGPILKGPENQNFAISESAEEKLRRLRRKARFGSSKAHAQKPKIGLSFSYKNNAERPNEAPAFLNQALSSGRGRGSLNDPTFVPTGQLVGTSQELEKPYLRLTTHTKPENVRPQEVLIKALAHIKSKYFREEDFEWANEQLKSVRQDITVQRIRNKFVLDVYETHARILLEHGDLAEFNQCQTMIRYLTTTGIEHGDDGINGSPNPSKDYEENESPVPLSQSDEASDEFRAYHVLYALVQNSWEDLIKALVRARKVLRENDGDCCKTASCRHALEVMKAVTHNDYRAFFKIYDSAPHMSAYLMDFLVKRMREKAFERIAAAYRPTICVEHFREALCFQDIEETRLFLKQMGAVFVKGEPPFWVDCKASCSKLSSTASSSAASSL